ncbi:MAG TPA: Fic family protein, partial [Gaiellaceae bacterium]|nr:Fic family protein [Gaiellaceae bacterium]
MAFFPYDARVVASGCEELDEWRVRLDRAAALSRRWVGRLRRDLEVEAVAASVRMEQVPVTVDEVRRILAGERPAGVSEQDTELVRGYREAMEFVLRRADDPGFQWNRELVVGLHDRVLAGNYALGAGRLAGGPRWVVDQSTGQEVFRPAAAERVSDLVDQACQRMEEGLEHPGVESAWIHVVAAAIHPFQDGNGRVCRVLASLAMYRGGFERKEFTSLEEWWGRHVADYYGAFACLGREFDETADVTPFLEAHVRAQLAQVRALDLRERVERRVWEALEAVVEDAGVPPRLVNATWDAFFERSVTPAYYISVTDVSRATATNDLRAAVAAGLLRPRGGGRSRHYV